MTDDSYEMIPHKLLSDLKYDVEALQKKLTEPDAKSNELILEIESMKDSIHELTTVFQKALEEMKDEGDIAKTVHTMKEKLDTVVTQNETIAKGMIAISDKVDEWMTNNASGNASQQQPKIALGAPAPPIGSLNNHDMGTPPPMPRGPARMAPKFESAMQPSLPQMGGAESSGDDDFPPPPPMPSGGKKRSGIFK